MHDRGGDEQDADRAERARKMPASSAAPAADEPRVRFHPLAFGVVAATIEMAAILLALRYC